MHGSCSVGLTLDSDLFSSRTHIICTVLSGIGRLKSEQSICKPVNHCTLRLRQGAFTSVVQRPLHHQNQSALLTLSERGRSILAVDSRPLGSRNVITTFSVAAISHRLL